MTEFKDIIGKWNMEISVVQSWIESNPLPSLGGLVLGMLVIYLISRLIFGRGVTYLTTLTKNKYDDIIAQKLRLYRAAWLVPFIILYIFAYLSPLYEQVLHKIALFFIIWLVAITLSGLIDAVNQIYEASSAFKGVSIQGYLDILKLLVFLVAFIITISLITGESPLILLSGLGALTAILLFVFQGTIMSLLASIQISINDLVKEGDWLEVPSFDADGTVVNVNLYFIRIQNWDNTISVIPTNKLMEASYRNWRGMQESGGRRIKRSVQLDQTTVRFCTPQMIDRYGRIDLITEYVAGRKLPIDSYKKEHGKGDSPLDGPQITNLEIFRAYTEAYLRNRPDIHTERMDFLVRELPPSPSGVPVEVYVFSKTTKWSEYECIQSEIFDHLLAAASFFDLRVFQEPTGLDFSRAFKK
jgi:miniconductance mechanosensitive channel